MAGATLPAAEAPGARQFEITAARYQFTPAQIEVRQGETVELVLRSADTDHGLEIKALKLKVAIPKGGTPVSASFVASRAGRFPILCSEYCGSGHRRMRGELIVTEAGR
jgi:cytochrome c oxidase subunit 2